MPLLADYVMDAALTKLDIEANRLDICSAEPTTYTQAITTFSLGNKLTPSVGAPAAGSPNGRQVTVAAISDGNVTGTGNATAWALVDTTNSRLLAAGALSASFAVTTGSIFTLAAFTVRIPVAV